jgi:guanylate kinase
MAQRINSAYDEIKKKAIYDHIVINDDVKRAADQLARIIEQSS